MHRLSLFLLIFSFPFQLGLHFWPSSSYLIGLPIDYLSPVIYLTDVFLLFYLITSFRQIKLALLSLPSSLFFFLPIVFIINIIFSFSPFTSLIFWFKLLLSSLLFLSLTREKHLLKSIFLPLLLSSSLIIILQFLQFFHQSSLQGIFYFLGERHLTLTTPFTAKVNLFSRQLLRPYSTFSHPNSLAGYLLLLLLLCQNFLPSPFLIITLLLSLLLTFSKSAIIILPFLFLISSLPSSSLILSLIPLSLLSLHPLLTSLLPSSFYSSSFFKTLPQSISQRLLLSRPSVDIFTHHFLTGTGLRAYLHSLPSSLPSSSLLPSLLQPIHSLLTLILIELGLFPFFLLFFFKNLFNKIKNIKLSNTSRKLLFSTLFIVLFTGAFDHYWWTLPQNQLILTLTLAIVFHYDPNKRIRHPLRRWRQR